MSSIIGLLTMCRRAGKLSFGLEQTKDACFGRSAAAVIVTNDISAKTLKEVKFVCHKSGVRLLFIDENMFYIANHIGRKAGVLAVCDKGFADAAAKLLEEISCDNLNTAEGDF